MGRILGLDGKPINPDPNMPLYGHGISELQGRGHLLMLQFKLAELRKSCGVEPEPRTLVFQRYPDIKK